MKQKRILFMAATLFFSVGTPAQTTDDSYLFTHLGAGLSIGTDGIGLELATPITPYLGFRAGVSYFPQFKVKVNDIENSRNGKDGKGSLKAKFKKIDGKALFDVYPFALKNSFHVTVGAFFGNEDLVKIEFAEDPNARLNGGIIPTKDNPNEYIVEPDANGIIHAKVVTNAVKPYFGIGFGRMVPKADKRIGVSCDIGVQLHGTPVMKAYAPDVDRYLELTSDAFGNDFGPSFREDMDDALRIISKVKVWPVLNVRLTGRIF